MGRNRHLAEVTKDRLADTYERYYHFFEPSEISAMDRVMSALEEIADRTRTTEETENDS